MPRPARVTSPASGIVSAPLLPLTITDRLMLETYLSNGQNATQAYLKHHPKAKYSTAESNGHKWLRKAKVQAELQRRLSAEHGITKAALESDLLWCAQQAKAKQDYEALASITMDCAKLAGFLVEQRRDLTPTPTLTHEQLADELRKRGFVAVPGN